MKHSREFDRTTNLNRCALCAEIETGFIPKEYQAVYQVQSRLCLKSANFVVLPSLSPLSVGHLLVIPRRHMTCMAEVDGDSMVELREVLVSAHARISGSHGTALFFEHGTVHANDTCCGITHAHLHVVPLGTLTIEQVSDAVIRHYPGFFECKLFDFLAEGKPAYPYLMYGQEIDRVRVTLTDKVPSQFLRKVVAACLNRKDWDWHKLDGVADFTTTLSLFSGSRPGVPVA